MQFDVYKSLSKLNSLCPNLSLWTHIIPHFSVQFGNSFHCKAVFLLFKYDIYHFDMSTTS